jgi:hypothetical protein
MNERLRRPTAWAAVGRATRARARLILPAWLATWVAMGALARPAGAQPPQPPPRYPLPVPFISQMYAKPPCRDGAVVGHKNCGPATAAMVIAANGRRPDGLSDEAFVDQVRERMTGLKFSCPQGNTTLQQMAVGAASYGLCLREWVRTWDSVSTWTEACVPVTVLIEFLPSGGARDWIDTPGVSGGSYFRHFVVIAGVDHPADTVWYKNPLVRFEDAGRDYVRTAGEGQMRGALASATPIGVVLGDKVSNACDSYLAPCNGQSAPLPSVPQDRLTLSVFKDCASSTLAKVWWVAGRMTDFENRAHAYISLGKGIGWQRQVVRLTGYEYRGMLRALRLKPLTKAGCVVGLSWAQLGDAAGNAAPGGFWPFYDHSGNPNRPLGTLLNWIAIRLTDLGPNSAWHLRSQSDEPLLQNRSMTIYTGFP